MLSQHLFASEHRDEIIRSSIEHAGNFIGITLRLRKEALTFESFMSDRLGKYSSDESITSLAEFVVQKITPRHPVRSQRCCFLVFLENTQGHQCQFQTKGLPTKTSVLSGSKSETKLTRHLDFFQVCVCPIFVCCLLMSQGSLYHVTELFSVSLRLLNNKKIFVLCVFLGACKAYPGSDRNMPCGKRPSVVQHCHLETLWGGEF